MIMANNDGCDISAVYVFQGDANRSEADDERQSLGYEDEEKLRELYAAGTLHTSVIQIFVIFSPKIKASWLALSTHSAY